MILRNFVYYPRQTKPLMKALKLAFPFLLVFTFSFALLAQSPEEEAAAIFDKVVAEFNQGEYDHYFSLLTDDMEAFTGIYTPYRFNGKASWMNFINGLKNYASVTYDPREATHRAYGGDVVVRNAYFVFTTVSPSGEVEVQNGRESTTMVKVNGQWMIANLHFSPIFE